MIRPVDADIGRKVVYSSPWDPREEGIISSIPGTDNPYRETHVFVRFRSQSGELTPLDRLEWL